jgi:hypothetical protein
MAVEATVRPISGVRNPAGIGCLSSPALRLAGRNGGWNYRIPKAGSASITE